MLGRRSIGHSEKFHALLHYKTGKCGQPSVLKIPTDKQISQTDPELKCDAWSRDFCLGTVDGIIGTCQSDFPWICPGLMSLGYRKLFHFHTVFWWNTCDTDSPTLPGCGDNSLRPQQWMTNLKDGMPRESLRRKEVKHVQKHRWLHLWRRCYFEGDRFYVQQPITSLMFSSFIS